MGFKDTTTRKLRAKLNGDHIRTREWNGKTLSYIEGWHALAEANRIFGFDTWSRETIELKCIVESGSRAQRPHSAYIARVRISVQAGEDTIVREGTGAGYTAAGSLAEAHALAAKEAETDATKRALATFGNPFGLALYDREQKNVRRTKMPVSKPILWEPRDGEGIVSGKYADPETCATFLINAFRDADTPEALQSLWMHNTELIAKLQKDLVQNTRSTRGNGAAKHKNGGAISNSHEVSSNEPDLLGAYQARYTELKDARASGPKGAGKDGAKDQEDAAPANGPPSNIGSTTNVETIEAPSGRIEKNVLAISVPKRIRAPEHLKWVATLPCLICQRRPSDAHHLKRVQPNAMGRKPGDQWVVPICRIHHRALHDAGDESLWWQDYNLEPASLAEKLWSEYNSR